MKILIKIEFYNQTLWLNGEKRVIRGVVLQYWNYKGPTTETWSSVDQLLASKPGCLKVFGTSSVDEEIPKHVLAREQLPGDDFYRTNTTSGVIVKVVIADAFYAFILDEVLDRWINRILPYKKKKNDWKETIRLAVCDLHDALNFPPNTVL